MRGVATRYPRFVTAYGRVMSIEDFLDRARAGDDRRAAAAPRAADNLTMTMLVKMASNGLPVSVDLASPEARAALARGKASFYRRVGERNHACADCHTAEARAPTSSWAAASSPT